jgi:hypothetical protein
MNEAVILPYALTVIGVLLSLLIGLTSYVFISLRAEVRSLRDDIGALSDSRMKLVHKEDCRTTVARIHDRLDAHKEELAHQGERLAHVEAIVNREFPGK